MIKRIAAVILIAAFAVFPVYAGDTPLCHYNFNEDFSDISGNGFDLTGYNCGIENGAVKFRRGERSYLNFPASAREAVAGSGAVSISMWVCHNGSVADSDYMFYMSNGTNAALELYLTSASLKVSGRSSSEDSRISKTYPLISDNRLTHITAVWDFANKKILCYVNGVKQTHEGGSDRAAFSGTSLEIGSGARMNLSNSLLFREFNGTIDDVRIYNRALTAQEITSLSCENEIDSRDFSSEIKSLLSSATAGMAGVYSLYENGKRVKCEKPPVIIENELYIYSGGYQSLFDYAAENNKKVFTDKDFFILSDSEINPDAELLGELKGRLSDRRFKSTDMSETVIYREDSAGLYLGSPSIVRLSSGRLVSSFDYFGPRNILTHEIYTSDDEGESWSHRSSISPLTWGTLFTDNGLLYIIGSNKTYGNISIYKSTDGGNSWSGAELFPEDIKFHSAPTAVLKSGGRIYKAFESGEDGETAPYLKAAVLSAPEGTDLMNPENWSMSERLPFDKSDIDGIACASAGFLEGNMVESPSGEILNILRTTIPPVSDKAAVLSLDGSVLSSRGLVNMPGGSHKFTIRWDEVSKKYIALTNANTDKDYFNQRNQLCLVSSEDLINWSRGETAAGDSILLSWNESVARIGYQYADFITDGDDLLAVIREADENAPNYHNSNRIAFKRIKNFRSLIKSEPIADWDFENVSGSEAYGGLTGIFSNSSCAVSAGYTGNGIKTMPGKTNTYMGVSDISERLQGARSMTINMRILPSAANGQLFKILTDGSKGGAIGYLSSGKVVFETRSSPQDGITRISSNTILDPSEWYFLSFTVDFKEKNAKIYINGVLDKETNNASFSSSTFTIGAPQSPQGTFLGAGSSVFDGTADDISVYPSVLNEKEISELYSLGPKVCIKDGEASVSHELNSVSDGEISLIVAGYDRNKLVSLDRVSAKAVKNLPCQLELSVKMKNINYSYYVFDGTLKPLFPKGVIYEKK